MMYSSNSMMSNYDYSYMDSTYTMDNSFESARAFSDGYTTDEDEDGDVVKDVKVSTNVEDIEAYNQAFAVV